MPTWGTECDRRLHRVVCYLKYSSHLRTAGQIGCRLECLNPYVFVDADFAGCNESQRSTSG
eukprot:8087165-Lingulodinium_polyedra.AAC.1